MNIPCHQGKINVVDDGLRRMSMGSIAHVDNWKNELVSDVHRLDILGVRFVDSTSWGALVHPSSESSLIVEVKKCQRLDTVLMELKDSVLIKIMSLLPWEVMKCLGTKTGCMYYIWIICRLGLWQSSMVPDISYTQVPPRCIMI